MREVLLEIGVKQLGLVRHGRDRRIGSHGANGLLSCQSHRLQQDRQIFLRIAKGLLTIKQGHIRARRARLNGAQIFQNDLGIFQPIGIGAGGRQTFLDLLIGDNASLFQIHQQHLARLQTPLGDNFFFRHRQDTHFGCHHHQPVIGDKITCRPQSVAVECRADLAAIGKGHRSRTIPWFHQRCMIFIEGASLLVHERIACPCFGDQHHHGMGERIAALHQKFQRIVKTGGVRLAFIRDGP